MTKRCWYYRVGSGLHMNLLGFFWSLVVAMVRMTRRGIAFVIQVVNRTRQII